jgi:hypothetical protein
MGRFVYASENTQTVTDMLRSHGGGGGAGQPQYTPRPGVGGMQIGKGVAWFNPLATGGKVRTPGRIAANSHES